VVETVDADNKEEDYYNAKKRTNRVGKKNKKSKGE